MANQIIIRIDPELKKKASHLAKTEGKNLSEVIRELLEDYIKTRDISAYIDDLWNRIGEKMKEKGYTENDIDSIIREVRRDK
jgi:predicted DNA-binding protein